MGNIITPRPALALLGPGRLGILNFAHYAIPENLGQGSESKENEVCEEVTQSGSGNGEIYENPSHNIEEEGWYAPWYDTNGGFVPLNTALSLGSDAFMLKSSWPTEDEAEKRKEREREKEKNDAEKKKKKKDDDDDDDDDNDELVRQSLSEPPFVDSSISGWGTFGSEE